VTPSRADLRCSPTHFRGALTDRSRVENCHEPIGGRHGRFASDSPARIRRLSTAARKKPGPGTGGRRCRLPARAQRPTALRPADAGRLPHSSSSDLLRSGRRGAAKPDPRRLPFDPATRSVRQVSLPPRPPVPVSRRHTEVCRRPPTHAESSCLLRQSRGSAMPRFRRRSA